MNRPWVIWLLLGVCGLLIVGAMGWLTRRTLAMEQERAVSEAQAKLEERVRLAMSRMDSVGSAMLVIENQRPPEHYQALYEPRAVFTNTLQQVQGGIVMQPSPLLSELPQFVNLHFEVWADKQLSSPQVPMSNERDLAEASGIGQELLERSAERLSQLRELLEKESLAPGQSGVSTDNLSRVIEACMPGSTAWNELPTEVLKRKSEWMGQQLKKVVQNTYGYANKAEQSAYQEVLTQVDKGMRLQVFNQAQIRALKAATKESQRLNREVNTAPADSSSSMAMRQRASRVPSAMPAPSVAGTPLEQAEELAGRPLADEQVASPGKLQSAGQKAEDASGQQVQVEAAAEALSGAFFGTSVVAQSTVTEAESKQADEYEVDNRVDVTPFQPVWLDGELLAVRRVRSEAGGIRYQGFWIDVAALKESMLAGISDLLPGAGLEPVRAVVGTAAAAGKQVLLANDSRALVTLPWRLLEGVRVDSKLAAVAPFPVALSIGWVAVVLAMLAAAGLVRGVMKMSERRAAFVSSVTHELRTPLTTFQLYSDLLAEGMVRDEDQRQSYLETMRIEAGRLNHLVENVLSYSRIERGSARARRERVALASLVDRFQGRLVDRAVREQARVEVVGIEGCADVVVETDVTAVEQIVFNLVDNACKYGLPDDGERVVTLRVLADRRKVRIAVCDGGHGVARRDRRRLFRPFHKSAHDAANSKPGVGLGLALCRRLAKALGGDITIDCKRERGACFVLTLPA